MKTTTSTAPKSVVYSFDGRWEKNILAGRVGVFFRKRRPINQPKYVFFYIGVPIKSIIGYASIVEIREVDLLQASKLQDLGSISDIELTKYIGHGRVHAIFIDKPVIFRAPKELLGLRNKSGFNPPQSFSFVDAELEAALIVDEK